MTWMLLLYGVLPLALFVLVDMYAGVKWAVVTAAVAAFADIFITRWITGDWDAGSCLAFVLVLGLGWVSVKLDNTLYFKMQPVVMSILFAALLAYYQLLSGQPLAQRYAPLLKKMAPPNVSAIFDQPRFYTFMDQTLVGLIGFFLVYAVIMALAAWKCRTVTWLLLRGVGFWVLLVAYFIVRIVALGLPA